MSATTSMTRVAIVNRGEAAVRFLRALRDYNGERGTAIRTIALYTEADRNAPFVKLADESFALGPALVQKADGSGMTSVYTHHEKLLAAIAEMRADAVWPGWGFVSEDADFAEALEARGITFIGPSAAAMRRLGDKIAAKRLATEAGVPMSEWHIVEEGEAAAVTRAAAERIGFPLVVKASAGGGGRGIRMVTAPADLAGAVRAVRDEAARSFGAGGIFLEACVGSARHIEIQLVVDASGVGHAIGLRDCSIQRRHQKVIEEAPSPVVHGALAARLEAAAVRLGEAVGYRGVGTVEFLVDPSRDFAHFLEVNTRLQVEHTITEATTGLDLVHIQIDIARGIPCEGLLTRPVTTGHAIEVRLNAEDPERGFQPSPGFVRLFRPPLGPGIRVDSGVAEGSAIAPEFDSMIAKLIATGRDRDQALARLRRALHELEIVVEDGTTNKAFLRELLDEPRVLDGSADTGWLDRRQQAAAQADVPGAFEAVCTATILLQRRAIEDASQRFFRDVQSGIPYRLDAAATSLDLALRGTAWHFIAHPVGPDRFLVGPTPKRPFHGLLLRQARFEVTGPGSGVLELERAPEEHEGGWSRHNVLFSIGKQGVSVEVGGHTHLVEQAAGGKVLAPAPALAVRVDVADGDVVTPGTRLCTLEAMKMELPVLAREAGIVREIACRPNQQVATGQVLLVVDSSVASGASAASARSGTAKAAKAPPLPASVRRALGAVFDGGRLDAQAIAALPIEVRTAAMREAAEVILARLIGWDAPAAMLAPIEQLLADPDAVRALGVWRPLVELVGAFADVEQLFGVELASDEGAQVPMRAEVAFFDVCRRGAVHPDLAPRLAQGLGRFAVTSVERSPELDAALFRIAAARTDGETRHRLINVVLGALMQLHEAGGRCDEARELEVLLARTADVSRADFTAVRDNARQARYVIFRRARLNEAQQPSRERALAAALAGGATPALEAVVTAVYGTDPAVLGRPVLGGMEAAIVLGHSGVRALVIALPTATRTYHALRPLMDEVARAGRFELHVYWSESDAKPTAESGGSGRSERAEEIARFLTKTGPCAGLPELTRIAASWTTDGATVEHRTWIPANQTEQGFQEETWLRGVHPERARRLELWRLDGFELERLAPSSPVLAFRTRARSNPRDERILIFAELSRAPRLSQKLADDPGQRELDWIFSECLRVLRDAQTRRQAAQRYYLNRIVVNVEAVLEATPADLAAVARRLEGATRGHGLQKVVVQARVVRDGEVVRRVFSFAMRGRHRLEVHESVPSCAPIRAASDYHVRVEMARRLGVVYPYEIVRALEGSPGADAALMPHPDMAKGIFVELELDSSNTVLVPTERARGENKAGLVVGLITHATAKHPEGMTRVFLASDPTRAMGALAEPECRRIIAALDIAEARGLPVEWLPVSSGAKIAMDSGTENLDWTARVLRRIIAFTQAGGEINIIVAGVNVGAQSYWNAEATMLMHTRGILIQTPEGSMVLTGKKALEVSGSVSAEDERGIGGFERVMGPNGQAQYRARNLGDAYRILFEHYAFGYTVPGERGPRHLATTDPTERSVLEGTVAELFSEVTNPGRKRPFAIRDVMRAVIDRDGGMLERFGALDGGETAAVWEAHVGGHAATVIGFESQNLPRKDQHPLDGPEHWTGGTLFPQSSKKVARAINQASGRRPVVVVANLSGFDGSPESMRRLQLEYGAEIGRAVVNFQGPIVFVVIGRYHGGAYVVFSKALNPSLTAMAVEGSYASVIGGSPAAAVVFPREVRRRALLDARVVAAAAELETASAAESAGEAGGEERPEERAQAAYDRVLADAVLEHQGQLAKEFDAIHCVERAVRVGSLDRVISAERLRPEIIAVLGRRS